MQDEAQHGNQETVAMLREVLPHDRWLDTRFLDWVYDHNPSGPVINANVYEDGRLVSHIGGVPMPLRSGSYEGMFSILLNSSTAAGFQGRGFYGKALNVLVNEFYARRYCGGFGVTNARSTGAVRKGIDGKEQGALGLKVHVPVSLPSRAVRTYRATPEWLASDEFAQLTADLDDYPVTGFVTRWTTETLRWRLQFPGADYWVHVTDELLAVTSRSRFKGVPITMLMKFLPRGGRRGPLRPDRLIATACLRHRTPVAFYAGYNAHVPVPGFEVAQDRLPAPLNLMILATIDDLTDPEFWFETYEFLDFDAY